MAMEPWVHHWSQALEIIESSEDSSEDALVIISHLTQIITNFLRVDPSSKSFWLNNKCSEKIIKWSCKTHYKGAQKLGVEEEKKFIQMLYFLCEAAAYDEQLLAYTTENNFKLEEPFSNLAILLLEYTFDTEAEEVAKDAFLLLLSIASKVPLLENLPKETGLGITNVLISVLNASFSQLPAFTLSENSEELSAFVSNLKFVDKVAQVAPESITQLISNCFTNAFLISVIYPSLTQDNLGEVRSHSYLHRHQIHHEQFVTSLYEEIATTTYYLQVLCETLTHPELIRSTVMFILLRLLPLLIERMNHPQISVAVSTMSLLNVLLDFYCEDVWYDLVLRYLLTQNHLMVSKRNTKLSEINFQDSSVRFLTLIPAQLVETLGQEILCAEYMQYLNNETQRWSSQNSIMFNITQGNVLELERDRDDDEDGENGRINTTFPNWKLIYDGTDPVDFDVVLESNGQSQNQTKDKENANANYNGNGISKDEKNQENENEEKSIQISLNESPLFTNVSLNSSNNKSNNIQEEEESFKNEKMSTSTAKSTSTINSSVYFGPFLDNLFELLSNWVNLNPEIILMITQLLSTLASSRIPIVNSLFLDTQLILQPSFTSFSTLLNKIRADLEKQLRAIPRHFIYQVWTAMERNIEVDPGRIVLNSEKLMNTKSNTNIGLGPNLETIGQISDLTLKFITAKFGYSFGKNKSSTSSSLSSPGSASDNSPSPRNSTSGLNNNRPHLSHSQSTSSIQTEASKLIVMKSIFFTHWLLEMGAIGQQLSWKNYSLSS